MNKKTLYRLFLEVILIALALFMLAVGRFRDEAEFMHVPEWVVFILLVIGFNVFLVIMRAVTFKRALLKLMESPPIISSAEPADFPQLDMHTFDHYDTQLTSLGFEPRFCYAFNSPLSADTKGLTRFYYHPLHKCSAANSQMFQGNMRMAMACINSELDDGWLLSIVNVKPDAMSCVWRRPRALWNAIFGSEPPELLDAHLQLRQRMIDVLGVGIVTADREQPAYFEFLDETHRQRLEALRKKNAVLVYLEYEFYKRKPICSWMGDLEKVEGAHRL